MSTFDDLHVGDRFTSVARRITEDDIDRIVEVGGYTHPLFHDRAYLEGTPFPSRPMPGQGALLLIGGLVEQTERFDDSVLGLVGLDEIRFRTPVVADDEVHVEVEVLEKRELMEKRVREMVMRWTLHNNRGNACVVAIARMLFR